MKRTTVLIPLSLCGCFNFSSYQLNGETLDLANDVAKIQNQQIIQNLDAFISDGKTIPSQVILTGGGVQITNSVQPSISLPGMNFSQHTKSLGVQAENQWVKNWAISPVNDPDDIRRLRALYRVAVWGEGNRVNNDPNDVVHFKKEYPQVIFNSPDIVTETETKSSTNVTTPKTSVYLKTDCARKTKPTSGCLSYPAFALDLDPDEPDAYHDPDIRKLNNLDNGWLVWKDTESDPPPMHKDLSNCYKLNAIYAQVTILHILYACPKNKFDEFVLWVLEATPNTLGTGGSNSTNSGNSSGAGKKPSNEPAKTLISPTFQ